MGDKSVLVRLKGDISDYQRAMLEAEGTTKGFTKSLDSSNDRMSNLVQSALALGPALVPISAAAIPAISGLTNELGFAVAGAGVAVLAFHGVGDALKAVNQYGLEPTAANLQKMNESLGKLGPDGQQFVQFLQKLRPELQGLQDAAQAGLFPGLESGISDVLNLLPQAERIVGVIAKAGGDLAADAGANLDSARFKDFFDFIEREARPTLIEMGKTVGNFAESFANLWVAFAPLSSNFSHSFLQLSRDFNEWTAGLSKTEGFQDFLDYVETNGPRVFDTLGSLGNALLQIVEAAAPIGSATLPVIKAMSDAIASIADSNLGPVIIGVVSLTSAYARLIALSEAANKGALSNLTKGSIFGGSLGQTKALPGALLAVESASERASTKVGELSATSSRLGTSLKGAAKLAGGGAGLAFVMSDLDDKMGLTNTSSLALAGSLVGPWGTAVGAGVGLALDLTHQTDEAAESVKKLQDAFAGSSNLGDQTTIVDTFKTQIAALEDAASGASGPAGDVLNSTLNKYKQGLADILPQYKANQSAARDQAFAEAGLTGQMNGASQAAKDQAFQMLQLADAHNKATNEALGDANAELAYARSVDAAREAAKKNGKTFDESTKKGQDNRQALYDLAGAWNNQSDAVKNTTGKYDKAKANFIATAELMGRNATEAGHLADKYLDIPASVQTKIVQKGAKDAEDAVKDLLRQIGFLHDKTININTVHTNTQIDAINAGRDHADGGFISGPGGPRDDSIPAWLSNGEFVVNAAATRRNLGLLHSINAQKYAAGGAVGLDPVSAGSTLNRAIERWIVEINNQQQYDEKHNKSQVAGDERLSKSLDKLGSKLTTLGDKMSSFSDSVSSNFLNDPFNKGGDNGSGGYRSNFDAFQLQVATDTANSREFAALLKKDAAKGLCGRLYGDLAASGDIETARGFSTSTPAQIAKLERQYSARSLSASSVAAQATSVVYAKQLNGLVQELAHLRKGQDLTSRTIDALAKQVGAAVGHSLASNASSSQNRASNSVRH